MGHRQRRQQEQEYNANMFGGSDSQQNLYRIQQLQANPPKAQHQSRIQNHEQRNQISEERRRNEIRRMNQAEKQQQEEQIYANMFGGIPEKNNKDIEEGVSHLRDASRINGHRRVSASILKEMKKKEKKSQNNEAKGFKSFFQTKFQCPICSCEYELHQKQQIFTCHHCFCYQCLVKIFEMKIDRKEEMVCLQQEENCTGILDQTKSFYQLLPEQKKKKYQKAHNFYVAARNPGLKMCPGCQEGQLQLQPNVDPTCPNCKVTFCRDCNYEKHKGPCSNQEVQNFKNKFNLQSCKKCGAIVQKVSGCNRIQCQCGCFFCFGCGETLGGLNVPHTCIFFPQRIEGILCRSDIGCGIPRFLARVFFSFPLAILVIPFFIILFILGSVITLIYVILRKWVERILFKACSYSNICILDTVLLVLLLPFYLIYGLCSSFKRYLFPIQKDLIKFLWYQYKYFVILTCT